MKKPIIIFTFLFVLLSNSYSQVINNSQIINPDHWIYDSLYKLGKEQKVLGFYDNTLLSVGEIKFYFKQIEYDTLSSSGKKVYERIYDFLNTDLNILPKISFIDDDAFKLGTNLIVAPELYYKSNPEIDWTFNYFYKNNPLTLPLIFGISDYITIESDLFFGKSHKGSADSNNISNIPYKEDDLEFLFLNFSYGSTGLYFDNWGINLNINRQGLAIGNTRFGSIFYNKTFETDAIGQLNVFSKCFKYSGDIIQVDYSKYLFIHQVELMLNKNFRFAIMEGSLLCQPAELRFTIPFMFMHQFSAWNNYRNRKDGYPYEEEKFCAYFGLSFDWIPVKNTRLYFIYAQNEIQIPSERQDNGMFYPDSLGFQLGTDISIPTDNDGYWNFNFEGVYASPYLYIKHTPLSSLYRTREDNLSPDNIKTWIGLPFGPDSIALSLSTGYEKVSKWNINLGYNLILKGEHDFTMFDKKSKNMNTTEYGEEEFYDYYPPNSYHLGTRTFDEVVSDALNMLPSGIIQYTNQIVIEGEYTINRQMQINSKGVYSFIYNSKHQSDIFEHGFELSLSFQYSIF